MCTAGTVPMHSRDIHAIGPTPVPESTVVTKVSSAFGHCVCFAYDKTCGLLSPIF